MIDPTDRLISSLGDDLKPVRRLPRLRSSFAVVLGVWGVLVGLVAASDGTRIAVDALVGNGIYFACCVALLVAAFAGTVSSLAAGTPGRERVEDMGMRLALLGLASGAVVAAIGMGLRPLTSPAGLDVECFESAAVMSLLPAAVILGFLLRGWIARSVGAAVIALLSAGSLGALVVHLHCGFVGPAHVLLGHLSVPIAFTLVGVLPMAVLLRRNRG